MDLSLVINELSSFRLMQYNSAFPIVFVEAKSPDDACFKATYGLLQIIMNQGGGIRDVGAAKVRSLCDRVKDSIRILKITT